MKIFNWVHRRFNHKDDDLTQNYHEKKNVAAAAAGIAYETSSTTSENDHDEQFVVVHNAFDDDDVLDGWNGGILTIGTFGYHPLLKEQNDSCWPTLEEEEEEEEESEENGEDNNINYYTDDHKNDENEEVNPLVYYNYHHHHDDEGLLEIKMDDALKLDELELELIHEFDHVMKINSSSANKKKKERTTLADLFIADSEKKEPTNKTVSGQLVVKEKLMNKNKNKNKNKNQNQNSFSFPKKLIGGEGRPMHKLNRLMRRMLKRKIHPDLDLNKYNPSDSKVWETKCEINESASLLPIQDVGI